MRPLTRLAACRRPLATLHHGSNLAPTPLRPRTTALNAYHASPQQYRTLYGVKPTGGSEGSKHRSTFQATPSTLNRRATSRPELAILTPAMCPPLSFWETHLPLYACADHLTAQALNAGCLAFCDGTKNRDAAWARDLVREKGLTPYQLHYMGIIIYDKADLAENPTRPGSTNEITSISLSMLHTAHLLDYNPSTLELACIAEGWRPAPSTVPTGKRAPDALFMFRGPNTRLQTLVRQGQDPSAMALMGAKCQKDEKDEESTRWYLKARRMGMSLYSGHYKHRPTEPQSPPRPQRWYHEHICHCVAGSQMMKERPDDPRAKEDALQAYGIAALEMGDSWALEAYAELLPDDDPRKWEFMVRAAVSGQDGACWEMARWNCKVGWHVENMKGAERDWRLGIVDEWMKLSRRWG